MRTRPWGRSSAGRASQWHCEGQGFDPPRLHHPPPKWLISARSTVAQPVGPNDARRVATVSVFLLLVGIVAATAVGRMAPGSEVRRPWLTWSSCLVLSALLMAQLRWPGLLPAMKRDA